MTATVTEDAVFTDLVNQLEDLYVIKILDDDVTPMDLVVMVFIVHFKLEPEAAVTLMLQVHNEGSAILDSGSEEEMLAHHEAMRHYKLRSKVEKAV